MKQNFRNKRSVNKYAQNAVSNVLISYIQSKWAFFKSLKKQYVNVSKHKTEIVLKNYNKEKINNYTYISQTSEWRFSPVTVTGLILSGGKSSEDCLHLLIVCHEIAANTFYVHDRN